jgi:hypothetical protein
MSDRDNVMNKMQVDVNMARGEFMKTFKEKSGGIEGPSGPNEVSSSEDSMEESGENSS